MKTSSGFKHLRDGLANAARAAGDETNFIGEVGHGFQDKARL